MVLHLIDCLLLRGSVVLLGLAKFGIGFLKRIPLLAGVVDRDLHLNHRHVVVGEIRAGSLPLQIHAKVRPEILKTTIDAHCPGVHHFFLGSHARRVGYSLEQLVQ